MRTALFGALICLAHVYSVASADTLRCGSYLIKEGDDASSVLAKCGEPTQRSTIREPVYAVSGNGGTYATDEFAETQVWRYDRGSTQFPVIVKISGEVVRSIRFAR
ncbi:MAG: DUF2845 domain-containing protein [Bradyrhizobium sp.]|nr:DUF2845 domain-containing protein [Bradyrhizobium sp.]MBV9725314.1 DUF2845 domain-containing protein [Gammaproteobacteria bacterium]